MSPTTPDVPAHGASIVEEDLGATFEALTWTAQGGQGAIYRAFGRGRTVPVLEEIRAWTTSWRGHCLYFRDRRCGPWAVRDPGHVK